jgi:hypothetical protein
VHASRGSDRGDGRRDGDAWRRDASRAGPQVRQVSARDADRTARVVDRSISSAASRQTPAQNDRDGDRSRHVFRSQQGPVGGVVRTVPGASRATVPQVNTERTRGVTAVVPPVRTESPSIEPVRPDRAVRPIETPRAESPRVRTGSDDDGRDRSDRTDRGDRFDSPRPRTIEAPRIGSGDGEARERRRETPEPSVIRPIEPPAVRNPSIRPIAPVRIPRAAPPAPPVVRPVEPVTEPRRTRGEDAAAEGSAPRRIEAPRIESTRPQTPRADVPRIEPRRIETPRIEVPRTAPEVRIQPAEPRTLRPATTPAPRIITQGAGEPKQSARPRSIERPTVTLPQRPIERPSVNIPQRQERPTITPRSAPPAVTAPAPTPRAERPTRTESSPQRGESSRGNSSRAGGSGGRRR